MEIIEPEDPLKVDIAIETAHALSNLGRPKLSKTVQFCSQPKSFVSRILSELKNSDIDTINLNDIAENTLPDHLSDVAEITLDCLHQGPKPAPEHTLPQQADKNPQAQKIVLKRQHVLDNELTIAEETEMRCKTLRDLKVEVDEASTSKPYEAEVQKTLNANEFYCDKSNCTYSTYLMCNLSKHKRIHTDEKPYLCDQCPFRTNFVNSLKVHRRIHTTERPYCCDQCGYKCNTISNLKKHKHHKHNPA